jgi:hypothetical protein
MSYWPVWMYGRPFVGDLDDPEGEALADDTVQDDDEDEDEYWGPA